MQANQTGVIWTVIIAALILLIANLWIAPIMIGSAVGTAMKIELAELDIDVPTAEEIASQIVVEGLDNEMLTELYAEEFKDETWEDAAIALATEELEDDDYESLYDYMVDEKSPYILSIDWNSELFVQHGLGLLIDDENDINEVIIKDIEVGKSNVDNEDAIVYFKLKVYCDTSTEDNEKVTVYSRVVIDDGDIEEDLRFTNLKPSIFN